VPIYGHDTRSRKHADRLASDRPPVEAVVTTIGTGLRGPNAMAGLDAPPRPPLTVEDPVILLVEDDDGDALLVRELMADGIPGAKIRWARSLREAIADADIADCALLDLGLPDTSGTEGVAALLAAAGHLAVVVLTGADSHATGAAALAAGAQDYLVKGRVDSDSLARSIRYALERRRATESARRLADAERRRQENARMERALLRPPLVRSDDVSVSIRYRPARAGGVLGGDFYDAIEHEDGGLHIVIGDVAGHGADEAALGARLRSSWRALVLADLDPDTVLATLEAVLRTEHDEASMFVTLCQVDIGPAGDAMDVRLAGHHPPFVIDDGSPDGDGADRTVTVAPAAPGTLLGPFPGARRRATTLALPARWRVLLYTDGLIEGRAHADTRQRLGVDATGAIVARLVRQGLAGDELLDQLLAAVEDANGEPLADDIALCLVEGRARG
jgi:serine phosphatase RsbU (regulator of sigma subunit)